MTLTVGQKATLKAAIQADSVANEFYVNGDLTGLAGWCNELRSPDFFIWRADVTRAEIYHTTSSAPESSTWNWNTYKAQNATEQNAWTQMFMGDTADFRLPNLRAGVAAIFTGSAAQNAQRDHVLNIGKRRSTNAERALSVGTGSKADPATSSHNGAITTSDLMGL